MIYSLEKINEMAEGDQDFIESLIGVFLEEVPKDLSLLENALEENNCDAAYKLAHKLKPNVDLLGMETARIAALEIESLGRKTQEIDKMRILFPQLKGDIIIAMQELKRDFGL